MTCRLRVAKSRLSNFEAMLRDSDTISSMVSDISMIGDLRLDR